MAGGKRRNMRGKKAPKQSQRQFQQRMQNTVQPKFMVKIYKDVIPKIPKAPRGPRPGCQLTVRQMTNTFTTQTGLSNVGGGGATAQLIQNGATAVLGAIAFQLDDIIQESTFSALFDQYRLEKVVLRFMCRSNAISVFNTASPNSSVPLVYVTQDRDDASAPASLNAVKEYDKVQVFNGTSSCDIVIEPRPTTTAFASGAFSGYTLPDVEPWIDVANTDVPHYGIKFAVTPLTATTSSSWVWDIEAYYWISFRNTR